MEIPPTITTVSLLIPFRDRAAYLHKLINTVKILKIYFRAWLTFQLI